MTQDDYKLWTGATVNYTDADWSRMVANASSRLASFLCLETLPTDEEGKIPDNLQEVLANFVCGTIKLQGGTAEVSSKHIRNFTINFRNTAADNAFALISDRYGDIIEKYSACGLGFAAEKSKRYCCGRI